MQYREIVAVTGLGGLYHLLSTKSDGAIVRSLAEGTPRFISSRQHSVTPLESIEIYTTGQNVRLHEVLQKMKESDTARPDAKSSEAVIRGYFLEVYPDMDEERVYTSDMKKMLKWFDILNGAELLDFSAMKSDSDAEAPAEDAASMPAEGGAQLAETDKGSETDMPLVEEGEEEKPAKKARAKKAASTEEGDEEKPAKKTAAKKKSAEDAEEEGAPRKKAKKKEEGE